MIGTRVRYRNNWFLELVCVCGRDAAVYVWPGTDVPRMRTAFRTLSLRTFDRLDCAKITLYIDILCIFATSGGVHALT